MADRQPASLTADTRLRVPLTVVSRKMRGELIVLRTGTEEYFNFQGSGPVLWELVERYHTVAAVVDRAAAVYRASVAAIGPDVRSFLDSLVAQGLLEVETEAPTADNHNPPESRPPLQIARTGLAVNGDLDGLREEFDRQNYLSLPQFIEPQLLSLIDGYVHGGAFVDRTHEGIGTELCLVPNIATKTLQLLFNDPLLFDAVQRIAGCEPLRCFDGRVYRMMADSGHYDSWHSDAGHDRRVAVSVNLSTQRYDGGVLEIRRTSSTDAEYAVPNNVFGSAVMFRISKDLRHRVTPVCGIAPRTAYAGWFCLSPDFQDKFFTALADR